MTRAALGFAHSVIALAGSSFEPADVTRSEPARDGDVRSRLRGVWQDSGHDEAQRKWNATKARSRVHRKAGGAATFTTPSVATLTIYRGIRRPSASSSD